MLEVGSGFSVTCPDGPAVLRIQIDGAVALGDHRFDGDAHACLEHDAVSPASVVRHLRVFVHLVTDTMSGQFTDDAVTLGFAMLLDSIADIAEMVSGLGCLNAFIECLLGGSQELSYIVSHLTHTEGVARVATEAIEQCAAVNGDDVALLEDRLLVGHAMHHDVVYRRTDAGWKRPSIWIREALESGDSAVVTYERVGYPIQLEGRYAGFDMCCQFAKGFPDKQVRLAHQLNFIFSLQKYLHRRILVCLHATSVDSARAEQTVVMAHQQVTLNLCKCVEHDTDENQQ